MAAIKIATYQNVEQLYTNAQLAVAGVADYYYSAAYEIVNLQFGESFDPELDLLAPFWTAYLAAQSIFYEPPAAVVQAVTSLQNHVLDKARDESGVRFSDINDWIDAAGTNGVNDLSVVEGRQDDVDTSFTVSAEFAVISDRAGFTIDSDNQDV